MPEHRIITMPFSRVYPLYVQKAERKNRTKQEVDAIICWLTGYDQKNLQEQINRDNDCSFSRTPRPFIRIVHSSGVRFAVYEWEKSTIH